MSTRRQPSLMRAGPDAPLGVSALRARLLARAAEYRSTAQTAPARFGHPQEFDEDGFPIAQRTPAFAERVRRLLAD
jgi:hypothetical protein